MGKPEKNLKCGGSEVEIFANEVNRNGQTVSIKKAVFQKRYKDHDGQWKSTKSLDVNDVPKAILVLFQAYAYIISAVDIPLIESKTVN